MKTYDFLRSRNYLVPETRYLTEELLFSDTGWVVKPDDGAGSEDCYLFEDEKTMKRFIQSSASRNYIQQRFLNGMHLSLSAVYLSNKTVLLSCNQQELNRRSGALTNKLLHHQVDNDCQRSFKKLVDSLGEQISGLRGYVGIDLVVNNQGPVILDINPRLTTSYAGLSDLVGFNVAGLILEDFI
jgi:predicted ATP-grasp superfamily ATP-dependent carboligase